MDRYAQWAQEANQDAPHYVIHVGEAWHSQAYSSRQEAQAWIDGYGVSQSYKDQNYRVVPVEDYWRNYGKCR